MSSALYAGEVTHLRLRPKRHGLRYRVVQGLFDLDDLPELGRRLRWFAHNRAAPIAFHDKDHGDGSGRLRDWVEQRLAEAGLHGAVGRIQLLCMPRMLGYAFNPLSVYFCHDPAGARTAMVYEVRNTFGERHTYVLPVSEPGEVVRQGCEKAFYVSPFMPMDLRYEFQIEPPDAAVSLEVRVFDAEGPLLHARFRGHRRDLTDGALLKALLAYPMMTLKVVAAIHWEALKLWLKGVGLVPRGTPETGVSEPVRS